MLKEVLNSINNSFSVSNNDIVAYFNLLEKEDVEVDNKLLNSIIQVKENYCNLLKGVELDAQELNSLLFHYRNLLPFLIAKLQKEDNQEKEIVVLIESYKAIRLNSKGNFLERLKAAIKNSLKSPLDFF